MSEKLPPSIISQLTKADREFITTARNVVGIAENQKPEDVINGIIDYISADVVEQVGQGSLLFTVLSDSKEKEAFKQELKTIYFPDPEKTE